MSVNEDVNRLIAEQVLHLPADAPMLPYSTDLNAAMQVVNWLKAQHVDISGAGTSTVNLLSKDRGLITESDPSPAFAICRAALRYVGLLSL